MLFLFLVKALYLALYVVSSAKLFSRCRAGFNWWEKTRRGVRSKEDLVLQEFECVRLDLQFSLKWRAVSSQKPDIQAQAGGNQSSHYRVQLAKFGCEEICEDDGDDSANGNCKPQHRR